MQQFLFNFAEKLLLPRVIRQPGQLFFITRLKFRLFGVHDSNGKRPILFGLFENHWSNEKTANSAVSMLYHAIENTKTFSRNEKRIAHIQVYIGDCARQNKNRFYLFFYILGQL